MAWLPGFGRAIRPWAYPLAAFALLLSQYAAVALASAALGSPFGARTGAEFWLVPLRSLARIPDLPLWLSALAFVYSLAVAGLLASLSFGRARQSGQGFALAAFAMVPVLQIIAVAVLASLPVRAWDDPPPPDVGANVSAIIEGLLTGLLLIVFAVILSTLVFGSYGWGLFVLTPFMVGITTGYLANRDGIIGLGPTNKLVLAATALGGLALIVLALEGLICIFLAAPLVAIVAIVGGAIGRRLAIARRGGPTPLMSVALLPLVFALEAAMPPNIVIETHEAIDIAAPPEDVWRALTATDDIRPDAGLVFRLGLAYPLRSRIVDPRVGGERIGIFSTGIARERITQWLPGRRLAFAVLSQPPAMAELSPYAQVDAPHVRGYFETLSTSFTLQPLPGGGTRLTTNADHILRLDPLLYWEPVARWAISQNVRRVLDHIQTRAETISRPDGR
jgi:hypothetical protein